MPHTENQLQNLILSFLQFQINFGSLFFLYLEFKNLINRHAMFFFLFFCFVFFSV